MLLRQEDVAYCAKDMRVQNASHMLINFPFLLLDQTYIWLLLPRASEPVPDYVTKMMNTAHSAGHFLLFCPPAPAVSDTKTNGNGHDRGNTE